MWQRRHGDYEYIGTLQNFGLVQPPPHNADKDISGERQA